MSGLLISAAVLWVISWCVYGMGIVVLSSLAATVMFCMRKMGVFVDIKVMLTTESLVLFLSCVIKLLFKSFSWQILILYIIVRAIFYSIVIWDTTQFVYVKEIHRKGE